MLIVGVYLVWRQVLHRAVNERLARIRAEGLPATAAELDKWYMTPPPGSNAADLYAEAFRAWKEPTEEQLKLLPIVGNTNFPSVGMPMSEEMRQAIEVFLSDNAETLRLLHEAARVNQCRYPIDFSQGARTPLPHIVKLRQSVKLLAVQTEYAARDGHAAAAASAILDGISLGESLRNEPVLISQVSRRNDEMVTMWVLEHALAASVIEDVKLEKIESALSQAEDGEALLRAMIGQRCLMNAVFEKVYWDFLLSVGFYCESRTRMGTLWIYHTTGLQELDQLRSLNLMSEYVSSSTLGWPDLVKEWKRTDTKRDTLPRYAILSGTSSGEWSSWMEKVVRGLARLRAAQAAIAAERYRLQHGQWPEQLVEPVPTDPFDGKPLRYRRMPTGFVVWSVGVDGRDDGGHESRPGSCEPDITFTVDRPPVAEVLESKP